MNCGHHIITDGCKECLTLQAKWYRTIAKDFNDIEETKYQERPLKAWSINILKDTTSLEIEITRDYYDRALEILHGYSFPNALIRRIWELHCEGLSRLRIERAVKKFPNAPKQSTIRNIIKDLEREFEW